MIIYKHSKNLGKTLYVLKNEEGTIGFVPTMGALHAGHIELVNQSRITCGTTVVSIFINPTQFNNSEDFKKYPVTLESDISQLKYNNCDLLFLPSIEEIYPYVIAVKPNYKLGDIETILEGRYRPGHFQGVCQVVDRLLSIVQPTHLFLGQKDYQQCLVLTKLIEILQLNIKIIICPTQREEDGLAMSSRNLRLDIRQRELAPEIYKSLNYIKSNFRMIEPSVLRQQCVADLEYKGFRVDYVEIVNLKTLQSFSRIPYSGEAVALIAAFIDDIRLIDNIILTDENCTN